MQILLVVIGFSTFRVMALGAEEIPTELCARSFSNCSICTNPALSACYYKKEGAIARYWECILTARGEAGESPDICKELPALPSDGKQIADQICQTLHNYKNVLKREQREACQTVVDRCFSPKGTKLKDIFGESGSVKQTLKDKFRFNDAHIKDGVVSSDWCQDFTDNAYWKLNVDETTKATYIGYEGCMRYAERKIGAFVNAYGGKYRFRPAVCKSEEFDTSSGTSSAGGSGSNDRSRSAGQ